jgi:hypothetical protein
MSTVLILIAIGILLFALSRVKGTESCNNDCNQGRNCKCGRPKDTDN